MSEFICPLCQSHFTLQNNSQVCENNHHFDIAKEGYLNLLPVNAKNSKNPGDNKEMMMARRNFLNSGGYLPLAEKLASLLGQLLSNRNEPTLLDLGCGEGYYTHFFANNLPSSTVIHALDISKVAIRYAAKRNKKINFCVASAYDVPLANESIDALVRIYAPSLDSELRRLIKEEGYLITVTPAPRHLFQLREKIYQQVNAHPIENETPPGFTKTNQLTINYMLHIEQEQMLKDLIQMTPFAWKFNQQTMQSLLAEKKWSIECDFNVEVYQKSTI